jgi:hypothetical protein
LSGLFYGEGGINLHNSQFRDRICGLRGGKTPEIRPTG